MDFTKVDEYLDGISGSLVPSNDIIIMQDHRVIHHHKCGHTDWDTMSNVKDDVLYQMYSASKPVTACAVMILCERGILSLDDPAYKYLPEFKNVSVVHRTADGKKELRPAKNPVLIRHLLSMTSGFDYSYGSAPIMEARKVETPECPTRKIVAAIAKNPLNFEPGSGWVYGLGHDILGAVVEAVSGMKFSRFVKENVFDPLGMTSSFFHPMGDDVKRLAPMYQYFDDEGRFKKVPCVNEFVFGTEYDSGGAGIVSSTSDMAVFADALACGGTAANGYEILKPETVKLMSTDVLNDETREIFGNSFNHYRGYGYGLGVRTLVSHDFGSESSIGEFGWAGAAGAYMLCDPSERLSVFCARNMLNSKEGIISPVLCNLIYEGYRA